MTRVVCGFLLAAACLPAASLIAGAAGLQGPIAKVQAVGPEGKGNAGASEAWRQLVQASPRALPDLFLAMDSANDLAANWLRSAIETIVDRALSQGAPLPLSELREYLLDQRHHPRARRLAYEIIARTRPDEAAQMIRGMGNDPSLELRYDAVQRIIEEGDNLLKQSDPEPATRAYQQALNFAREVKQIRRVTDSLKHLGVKLDLPRHFGFLMDWQIIGPFDNTGRKGFDAVFPPERELNLSAEYPGKTGPVQWKAFRTTHDYGLVDLNKACGTLKEVTGYAFTEYVSEVARSAELRLGCKNAWKVWFNGRLLFARDEYHRGMRIDQYSLPVELSQGKNTILIKLCQNEQTEEWTKEWEFQLRVCDATGTAILPVNSQP